MINRDSQVTFDESNVPIEEPLLITENRIIPTTTIEIPQAKDLSQQAAPSKDRLHSLDVYRGLTVFGMILVDYINEDVEGAIWWLIHPQWNGFTPADLVFPTFLFIMGLAIPMSVSKGRPIRAKNIIRVFLLFFIGLFLNIIEQQFDFPNLRIPGILQRLAVCYGIILLLHWATEYGTHSIKRVIGGCVMVGIVILYMTLMLSWSDQSIGCFRDNNLDPYCNFAGYVDRAVFGQSHIMQKTDPEGIISTFTAVFTTYVGYLFGMMILKMKSQPQRLIKYWLLFAFISLLPVYPCSLLMPFNKRLYTITYLFLVLSTCATALSFFVLMVDIVPKKYKQTEKIIRNVTQPMNWLGLNPLAVFVIMQIMSNVVNGWIVWGDYTTPYTAFYDSYFSWMSPYWGTALYSLFYCICYTLIGGLLFKFKIFVRL